MLRDDIARYTELSGNDGEHTPIGIIGAYLDGYEKGLKSRENIHGEWIKNFLGIDICSKCGEPMRDRRVNHINFCNCCGADMRGE